MKIPIRVFVYGTLKTGEPNHHVLAETAGNFKFEGKGRTVSKFPLVVGSRYNVPMMLLDEGKGKQIHGEVYSVDTEKLAILDELEAYPNLYTREQKEIALEDGSNLTAWIYMIPQWRENIFEESSDLLEDYSSKGSHGREYVERYVRAKDILDDEFNLFAWIKGLNANDEKALEDSKQKAKNDLCAE